MKIQCFLLTALMSVALVNQASAAPAKSAQDFLEAKHTEVASLLKAPSNKQRDAALSKHLDELLDYGLLAKRALSSQWDKRTPAERTEFVALLRQLVERQYQKNLENTLDFKIEYAGNEAIDDGTLVKTLASSKKKRRAPAIEIDYSLHHDKTRWRVFDIATDGVSLVKNYRRQFRRIVRKEGWTGLLKRMKKKHKSDSSDF